MFYYLSADYSLRGWKMQPCVLLKSSGAKLIHLDPDEFRLLVLCDGKRSLEDDLLTDKQKTLLRQYLEDGIVNASKSPHPTSSEQKYRYYHNRFIPNVLWSITGRCNFRCRHCYMDAPGAAMGQLSTEDCLKLIRQMAKSGIPRIELTGGEPLVRQDFWQIFDKLQEEGICVAQIYTNGWLVNDDLLNGFEKRGQKPSFSMSFDGIGWHDWMRGVQGAEKKTLEALSVCHRRGFPTNVEMCIHKGNLSTLTETMHALAEVGVSSVKASKVSETALWKKNSESHGLTDREYYEDMINYIPEYFRENTPMKLMLCGVIDLYPKEMAERLRQDYHVLAERRCGDENCMNDYLCGAIRTSPYIAPNGQVLPCMPMTSAVDLSMFPNAPETDLQQIFDNSFLMEYADSRVRDLTEQNRECKECPHLFKCGGGCRAKAFTAGDQNLMGTDRSACILFKEGYAERIHKTAEEAVLKYRGRNRLEPTSNTDQDDIREEGVLC